MKRLAVLILIAFLLLSLSQASNKKLRRGWNQGSSSKYESISFNKHRVDDDDYIRRNRKDDDVKIKSNRYQRMGNVYASKKAEDAAQKMGKHVGNFISRLLGSKTFQPKYVSGKKVKVSYGPGYQTNGVIENWALYMSVAFGAATFIVTIDCLASKKSEKIYEKPIDEIQPQTDESKFNHRFEVLAFIMNGGNQSQFPHQYYQLHD